MAATVSAIDPERRDALAAAFSGSLIVPNHERYEEVRKVHNGLIDKRPLLIARCHGTADVVESCH